MRRELESVLTDKAIVIIGGTTGLGFSAARAMVNAGARVVVVGRKSNDVEAAADALNQIRADGCRGHCGDAIDSQTSITAVGICRETFGRFDGLYHVAGGSGRRFGDGPLHEVTDEGVQKTIELNLQSVIFSNRAAVQGMLELGTGGAILNMGSVLGSSPSPTFFATHVYAATKSAIVGFTKSAAAYYAPKGIRLNVIAPALVNTPMAARATTNDEIMQFMRTKQPLDGGRVGVPEDLDQLAVYFFSDHSRFVTGQVVAVDGGWSVSEGQVNSK